MFPFALSPYQSNGINGNITMSKKKEVTLKKKLTLDHFLTKSLQEKPTKLPLSLNGEETDEYLLVIGTASAVYKRPFLEAQFAYKEVTEQIKLQELSGLEAESYKSNNLKEINNNLAQVLCVGWSLDAGFDIDLLLEENEDLSASIVAHANDVSNYQKK